MGTSTFNTPEKIRVDAAQKIARWAPGEPCNIEYISPACPKEEVRALGALWAQTTGSVINLGRRLAITREEGLEQKRQYYKKLYAERGDEERARLRECYHRRKQAAKGI